MPGIDDILGAQVEDASEYGLYRRGSRYLEIRCNQDAIIITENALGQITVTFPADSTLVVPNLDFDVADIANLTASTSFDVADATAGGGLFKIRGVSAAALAPDGGTTITFTDLIPAGSMVLAVLIQVALTFGGSVAALAVGDGSDADKWGAAIASAAGTVSSPADFTAAGPTLYAAATDVVLTADDTLVEDAGKVYVTVFYYTASVPVVDETP